MVIVNVRFSEMSFDDDDFDDYVASGLDSSLSFTFVGVATLHECASNVFFAQAVMATASKAYRTCFSRPKLKAQQKTHTTPGKP
jgi:hypothetical protein